MKPRRHIHMYLSARVTERFAAKGFDPGKGEE